MIEKLKHLFLLKFTIPANFLVDLNTFFHYVVVPINCTNIICVVQMHINCFQLKTIKNETFTAFYFVSNSVEFLLLLDLI